MDKMYHNMRRCLHSVVVMAAKAPDYFNAVSVSLRRSSPHGGQFGAASTSSLSTVAIVLGKQMARLRLERLLRD